MYNVSSIFLYITNINSFNYNIIVQSIITVYIYICMYTVCNLYAILQSVSKHGVHTFFEGSVTLRTVSTSSMTSYTGASSVVIGRLVFCGFGRGGKSGPLGFTSLDVQTVQGA